MRMRQSESQTSSPKQNVLWLGNKAIDTLLVTIPQHGRNFAIDLRDTVHKTSARAIPLNTTRKASIRKNHSNDRPFDPFKVVSNMKGPPF